MKPVFALRPSFVSRAMISALSTTSPMSVSCHRSGPLLSSRLELSALVFRPFGLLLDDYAAALPAVFGKETALLPISSQEGHHRVGRRRWMKNVLLIPWDLLLLSLKLHPR